jgi:hypothetical protein
MYIISVLAAYPGSLDKVEHGTLGTVHIVCLRTDAQRALCNILPPLHPLPCAKDPTLDLTGTHLPGIMALIESGCLRHDGRGLTDV